MPFGEYVALMKQEARSEYQQYVRTHPRMMQGHLWARTPSSYSAKGSDICITSSLLVVVSLFVFDVSPHTEHVRGALARHRKKHNARLSLHAFSPGVTSKEELFRGFYKISNGRPLLCLLCYDVAWRTMS
jgi:hypothetical protein